MDLPILNALEILLSESAMTIPEALEKAYKAGHRTAVKSMEPIQLIGLNNDSSTRGLAPVK